MGTPVDPAQLQSNFTDANSSLTAANTQLTYDQDKLYGDPTTGTTGDLYNMEHSTGQAQLAAIFAVCADLMAITGDKLKVASGQLNVMSSLSAQVAAIQQQNAACLNDVQGGNSANLPADSTAMVQLLQNFQGDLTSCAPWMDAPNSPYASVYTDLTTTTNNLVFQLSNGYTTSATATYQPGDVGYVAPTSTNPGNGGQNILADNIQTEYSYYQSYDYMGSSTPTYTPSTQENNTLQLIGTLVTTTSALSKQGTITMNAETQAYTTFIQSNEFDLKKVMSLQDYQVSKQTAN
jgi:hypothetical protein